MAGLVKAEMPKPTAAAPAPKKAATSSAKKTVTGEKDCAEENRGC